MLRPTVRRAVIPLGGSCQPWQQIKAKRHEPKSRSMCHCDRKKEWGSSAFADCTSECTYLDAPNLYRSIRSVCGVLRQKTARAFLKRLTWKMENQMRLRMSRSSCSWLARCQCDRTEGRHKAPCLFSQERRILRLAPHVCASCV